MIQPIDINDDNEGKEKSYRVHDMVLDLVCLLPSEENFVTRLHDTEQNSGQIQRQEIQDYPSKRAYGRYDYHQEHASDVVSCSSCVIVDPASTYQSRSLGLPRLLHLPWFVFLLQQHSLVVIQPTCIRILLLLPSIQKPFNVVVSPAFCSL
jgi:hypothetical protein